MESDWLENAPTGQRVRLLTLPGETGGRSFVLEYINKPFTGERAVPAHVHSRYTETFEVLRGRARYRLAGEERTAEAGARIVMPPRVVHVHPWSDSAEELHVRQTAVSDPPDMRGLLNSLQAAITIYGLASAGRVNRKGDPPLLQLAVLADTTIPATYLAAPAPAIQRPLIRVLAAIGRACGYRARYAEYGILTADGLSPRRGGVSI
jgi:mannose-6-phosphate isomerase-like protein (cupin superfamily)